MYGEVKERVSGSAIVRIFEPYVPAEEVEQMDEYDRGRVERHLRFVGDSSQSFGVLRAGLFSRRPDR